MDAARKAMKQFWNRLYLSDLQRFIHQRSSSDADSMRAIARDLHINKDDVVSIENRLPDWSVEKTTDVARLAGILPKTPGRGDLELAGFGGALKCMQAARAALGERVTLMLSDDIVRQIWHLVQRLHKNPDAFWDEASTQWLIENSDTPQEIKRLLQLLANGDPTKRTVAQEWLRTIADGIACEKHVLAGIAIFLPIVIVARYSDSPRGEPIPARDWDRLRALDDVRRMPLHWRVSRTVQTCFEHGVYCITDDMLETHADKALIAHERISSLLPRLWSTLPRADKRNTVIEILKHGNTLLSLARLHDAPAWVKGYAAQYVSTRSDLHARYVGDNEKRRTLEAVADRAWTRYVHHWRDECSERRAAERVVRLRKLANVITSGRPVTRRNAMQYAGYTLWTFS